MSIADYIDDMIRRFETYIRDVEASADSLNANAKRTDLFDDAARHADAALDSLRATLAHLHIQRAYLRERES